MVSQIGKYKRKSQIPADTELVFNSGTIERHRSSMVKLPLPPRPTCSNKFRMDFAYPARNRIGPLSVRSTSKGSPVLLQNRK